MGEWGSGVVGECGGGVVMIELETDNRVKCANLHGESTLQTMKCTPTHTPGGIMGYTRQDTAS